MDPVVELPMKLPRLDLGPPEFRHATEEEATWNAQPRLKVAGGSLHPRQPSRHSLETPELVVTPSALPSSAGSPLPGGTPGNSTHVRPWVPVRRVSSKPSPRLPRTLRQLDGFCGPSGGCNGSRTPSASPSQPHRCRPSQGSSSSSSHSSGMNVGRQGSHESAAEASGSSASSPAASPPPPAVAVRAIALAAMSVATPPAVLEVPRPQQATPQGSFPRPQPSPPGGSPSPKPRVRHKVADAAAGSLFCGGHFPAASEECHAGRRWPSPAWGHAGTPALGVAAVQLAAEIGTSGTEESSGSEDQVAGSDSDGPGDSQESSTEGEGDEEECVQGPWAQQAVADAVTGTPVTSCGRDWCTPTCSDGSTTLGISSGTASSDADSAGSSRRRSPRVPRFSPRAPGSPRQSKRSPRTWRSPRYSPRSPRSPAGRVPTPAAGPPAEDEETTMELDAGMPPVVQGVSPPVLDGLSPRPSPPRPSPRTNRRVSWCDRVMTVIAITPLARSINRVESFCESDALKGALVDVAEADGGDAGGGQIAEFDVLRAALVGAVSEDSAEEDEAQPSKDDDEETTAEETDLNLEFSLAKAGCRRRQEAEAVTDDASVFNRCIVLRRGREASATGGRERQPRSLGRTCRRPCGGLGGARAGGVGLQRGAMGGC
eukprot:TRINITY_DN16356_c0_g1_i2.p1 TRINITY_DN16356_c0_g1~~TRINITY_DN16356_c0_g1_i2.p1  ORF type:complete len:687 (-),score=118.20 TRINITY_DN16356_c0_g1_i2:187-2154(-)